MIRLTHKLNLEKGGGSMADFPRVKWVNFDGNTIPFTEPQHFTGNGDETVRTGHDNPLPVANYTKKGNIWLPVSEENPVPTQVTGSNTAKELLNGVTVTAGSNVSTDIERVYANRVGIGVRWDKVLDFRVNIRPRLLNSSIIVDEFIGYEGGGSSNISIEYTPKLPRFNVRLFNESTENRTIIALALTYFY